jgi:hypothetical protein
MLIKLIKFLYLWKRVLCAALITKKHILLPFLVLRINKFVSPGYEFQSMNFCIQAKKLQERRWHVQRGPITDSKLAQCYLPGRISFTNDEIFSIHLIFSGE